MTRRARRPLDRPSDDSPPRPIIHPRGPKTEPLGDFGDLEEGSRYATRVATGDELSGVVRFVEKPTSFVATAKEWNDALLRVKLESLYGLKEVHVWLSTCDVSRADVAAFQQRMQAELERLFIA